MTETVESILLEVSPGETRAASIDGAGRLVGLQIERMGEESLVGAVCRGRVTRIEKATDIAFLDIGLPSPGLMNRARGLHEGQALTVQIVRDAWGEKGPAVTASVALSGRYLVLRPTEDEIRWPRTLPARLRREHEAAVAAAAKPGEGITVRSNVTLAEPDALAAEAERLRGLWQDIEKRAKDAGKPALLLPAPGLAECVLRDEAPGGGILVDDRRLVAELAALAKQTAPDLAGRIAFHDGRKPIFDEFGVDDQIAEALSRVVALPRGAGLVFDELEALTAIDVNMGGAGVGRASDDAILAFNRSAAAEAARQVMLRNIAGLIVIDFVSMRNKGNRRHLVEAVRRCFAEDRVTVDVLGMTPAGLVEVTRQRRGRSLASLICMPAEREIAMQPQALACAALRAALRMLGAGRPVLRCPPAVAAALRGALAPALAETERRLGQALAVREDAGCPTFELLREGRHDGQRS
jgi:Rne/Rng family ribonuclease